MSNILSEGEALIKLIPAVEKAIADAKTASADPAVLQVMADLQAIIADVKAGISTPAPVAPPQAAS